jgi:hypothetical protein
MCKTLFPTIRQWLLTIAYLLILSPNAHATVGGDDDYEILGIDQHEQKLFFSIIDGDGSGYVDEVFYIDLNTRAKPVFAKSLYRTGNIEDCDSDDCRAQFLKKLGVIKKRLTPLTKTTTNDLYWRVVKQNTQSIPWYGDPELPTPEHHTDYQLVFKDDKKTLKGNGHAVYYHEQFRILEAYTIPNRIEMLVVMEYLGKPFEFGYKKHDVVLLSPQ